MIEIEQSGAQKATPDQQESRLLPAVVADERQGSDDEGQDRRHGPHDRMEGVARAVEPLASQEERAGHESQDEDGVQL